LNFPLGRGLVTRYYIGGIMEVVKKTDSHTIVKKRSGRYGVQTPTGGWLNGAEKAKILADEGLIKLVAPAPAPVEEAPADEAAAETEAPAAE
jgi:hypothetical protein